MAGRSGQKGGRRTATLYTAALKVSSGDSFMMSGRVTRRGSPIYVGYCGIVRSDKHSKTHIQYLLMFQCRIQRVMQVVTSCQNRIGWPGLARMVVLQT